MPGRPKNELGVPVRRRRPPPSFHDGVPSAPAGHSSSSSCETSEGWFHNCVPPAAWRMGKNGGELETATANVSGLLLRKASLCCCPSPSPARAIRRRRGMSGCLARREERDWLGVRTQDQMARIIEHWLHLYMGNNLAALRAQIPRFHVEPSAATAGRSSARATRASAAAPSAGAAR